MVPYVSRQCIACIDEFEKTDRTIHGYHEAMEQQTTVYQYLQALSTDGKSAQLPDEIIKVDDELFEAHPGSTKLIV